MHPGGSDSQGWDRIIRKNKGFTQRSKWTGLKLPTSAELSVPVIFAWFRNVSFMADVLNETGRKGKESGSVRE